MKRLFAFVLSVIASGYVVEYAFKGMNSKSDLLYVGGMIGLFAWIALMFICWIATLKGEKKRNEKVQNVGGSAAVSGVDAVGGVYNENRAGDGGNRS